MKSTTELKLQQGFCVILLILNTLFVWMNVKCGNEGTAMFNCVTASFIAFVIGRRFR